MRVQAWVSGDHLVDDVLGHDRKPAAASLSAQLQRLQFCFDELERGVAAFGQRLRECEPGAGSAPSTSKGWMSWA